MKLTREMLSTVAYTLGKRVQGYTLLKNPKGSNPNDVSMIKTSFGTHFKYLDDIFVYKKLQRQKVNDSYAETERTLVSTHYMDTKTKKITNKKSLLYAEYNNKNDQLINSADRFDLSEAELKKRQKPQWNNDIQEIEYSQQRYRDEYYKAFYQPPVSVLENILCFGQYKLFRRDSRPVAPGFIKTLITNLKGG